MVQLRAEEAARWDMRRRTSARVTPGVLAWRPGLREGTRAPYATLVARAALAIVAAALADCQDAAHRWLTLASDPRGSMAIDATRFRVIEGQPDAWVRVRFSTARSFDGIAFISYL